MNRTRIRRSSGFWASAAWVAFLILMAIRVAAGAAGGGPVAVLLTFALIVLGTLGLIAAITAGIALKRRPLRRLQDALKAVAQTALVMQAMGTDDFFLGLRLLDPSDASTKKRLGRIFVLRVVDGGLEFWSPKFPDASQGRIAGTEIAGMSVESINGPVGRRPTVCVTVRGEREVVLSFLPISERGAGLKPMDGSEMRDVVHRALPILNA